VEAVMIGGRIFGVPGFLGGAFFWRGRAVRPAGVLGL
jgi:hypothetical protein